MRIYHLAVLATVACVPLAACVPTFGSMAQAMPTGGIWLRTGAGGRNRRRRDRGRRGLRRGPYYGYRGPYGADGD
jgi:hypothetical protein